MKKKMVQLLAKIDLVFQLGDVSLSLISHWFRGHSLLFLIDAHFWTYLLEKI